MKNMKNFVLGALFICFAGAFACEVQDECQKDEDCPEGCCAVTKCPFPFNCGKTCVKFLSSGASCIKQQETWKKVLGYTYYTCSCAPGLSCTSKYSFTFPYFGKIQLYSQCSPPDKKDDKKEDDKKEDKKEDDKKEDDKKEDEKEDDKKEDDKKEDDKKER